MKTTVEQILERPENRRIVEQEKLAIDVFELLCKTMEEAGVSRAELAKRLGKSKAYVTQVLNAHSNVTLRTLADLFFALNQRVAVGVQPCDSILNDGAKPVNNWGVASACFEYRTDWGSIMKKHRYVKGKSPKELVMVEGAA